MAGDPDCLKAFNRDADVSRMESDPLPAPQVGWALTSDLPPGHRERERRQAEAAAAAFDEEEFMASLFRLDCLLFRRPLRRLQTAGPDSSLRKKVIQWAATYGSATSARILTAQLWLFVSAQFGLLLMLELAITRGRRDPLTIALFVLAMGCCVVSFAHGVAAWLSGRRQQQHA